MHPRERFSDAELGLSESDVASYDALTSDALNQIIGCATQELLHGSPIGVKRIAAIDTLHALASKLGFELVPVERIDV